MPDTTKFAYWSSLYFLATGATMLLGYWTPFGINILSYLSVSDIIKLTIYPIVFSILVCVINLGGAHLIEKIFKSEPRGITVVEIVAIIIVAAFASLLPDPYNIIAILGIFNIAVSIWAVRAHRSSGGNQKGIKKYLVIAAATAALVPVEAFAFGYFSAKELIHGRHYLYIANKLPHLSIDSDEAAESRPRLIGHVNDYVFLYLPDKNSVAVIRFNTDTALELKRHSHLVHPHKILTDMFR